MKLAAAKAIADSVYRLDRERIVPETLNLRVSHEVSLAVQAAMTDADRIQG